jgi:hypothetical protein
LQDLDEQVFQDTIVDCSVSPQVANWLVRIDRSFAPLPVPTAKLKAIGWVKLAMVAPYISKENYLTLLKHAEHLSDTELGQLLRGEDLAKSHKRLLLLLRPDEIETLDVILLSFGAVQYGSAFANREAALMNLAWYAHNQLTSFPIEDDEPDEDEHDFASLDEELAWVESKVTAKLENRLQRLLQVLARLRAERDSLQQQVSVLTVLLDEEGAKT